MSSILSNTCSIPAVFLPSICPILYLFLVFEVITIIIPGEDKTVHRTHHWEEIIERTALVTSSSPSSVHWLEWRDARSIKISTWVSVDAGLSLHRHQANFSRAFDIYFARYYWNIFTLFPQIFFISLIFHLVFCPLETGKQCNVLKA